MEQTLQRMREELVRRGAEVEGARKSVRDKERQLKVAVDRLADGQPSRSPSHLERSYEQLSHRSQEQGAALTRLATELAEERVRTADLSAAVNVLDNTVAQKEAQRRAAEGQLAKLREDLMEQREAASIPDVRHELLEARDTNVGLVARVAELESLLKVSEAKVVELEETRRAAVEVPPELQGAAVQTELQASRNEPLPRVGGRAALPVTTTAAGMMSAASPARRRLLSPQPAVGAASATPFVGPAVDAQNGKGSSVRRQVFPVPMAYDSALGPPGSIQITERDHQLLEAAIRARRRTRSQSPAA